MIDRRSLARRAIRAALETRHRSGEDKADPVCVYDLAERLGVEVNFCLGNSFGGGYARASQTVLVPTLRPAGRQAFTCGHELGHWYFGHGNRLDELSASEIGGSDDPDEILANFYAGYLLMPIWAVTAALAARGWVATSLTPIQAYTLACQFGVGYETLIRHLRGSLHLMTFQRAEELLNVSPKSLRSEVIGDESLRHMVVVDSAWRKVAIDLQVGDVAVVMGRIHITGACVRLTGTRALGAVIEAVKPGVTTVQSTDPPWTSALRVRRKDFHGRSLYRHMEDPDVDEVP